VAAGSYGGSAAGLNTQGVTVSVLLNAELGVPTPECLTGSCLSTSHFSPDGAVRCSGVDTFTTDASVVTASRFGVAADAEWDGDASAVTSHANRPVVVRPEPLPTQPAGRMEIVTVDPSLLPAETWNKWPERSPAFTTTSRPPSAGLIIGITSAAVVSTVVAAIVIGFAVAQPVHPADLSQHGIEPAH
jgi:hypothetical protein